MAVSLCHLCISKLTPHHTEVAQTANATTAVILLQFVSLEKLQHVLCLLTLAAGGGFAAISWLQLT